MNDTVCREFLAHLDLDGSLQCESPPDHIISWLDDLNLPDGLACLMMQHWPQKDGLIARHIRISSSATLYADEVTGPLLKHKFLNVGSGPNGDFFLIDFSTAACVPGFIAIEEWDPSIERISKPRKLFQAIARSFGSFLYRAVEGLYLPTDYHAAKAFNAFLAKEPNT